MPDAEGSKICTYMYSVSCSIIAEVLMIFGYRNNAWLVFHNDENEIQRGLNDDCLKTDVIKCHSWRSYSNSSMTFPGLSTPLPPPSTAMYIALYTARGLLLMQTVWFISCIICCCNLKAEEIAKKYQRFLLQFCASIGIFPLFYT
ncbi:hypothetical protein COOONC_15118 [Cooperia oncophora]